MLTSDPESIVDAVLRDVGKHIVLGLPLGLGKANHIANALFTRAVADPSISLHIFTALTLEPPPLGSGLERRFIEPLNERLFAGYPPLLYAQAQREGRLPSNIQINEFFFLAGRWLSNPSAQRNYIAANYTHAARCLLDRGVNVIAQLVAPSEDGRRYSLSCNPDLTLDLLRMSEKPITLLGEVNGELPFMYGEADLPATAFAHMLTGHDFPLFAPPKAPVDAAEYAMGLHAARLVPDGGTLQIGIGQEADAIAHSLILRHRRPQDFQAVSRKLGCAPGEETPFAQGLHGLSEMFVDVFLDLVEAGVLTREVNGAVMHGAFFLGPRNFYRRLRDMPEEQRRKFHMTAISFTNDFYGDAAAKRPSRIKARFINNAMMATLLGAVVSDGLEDGQVVSGVGGQYNFVEQAIALPDARSIILVKAARGARSNIRWRYGHETIPRHLRDIVISEYGVADLRGKTDRDVVAAMLGIADSRFQEDLLREAKAAGKIERAYEIPAAQRNNTPERIAAAFASFQGLFPAFPFGTDFTPEEQRLLPALATLKAASASPARLIALALKRRAKKEDSAALARMGLNAPTTLKERAWRRLVGAALESTHAETPHG